MTQSYSPFPLTASVSPETRLHQPGEVSGGASVTLHGPSGNPPVQAWKYTLPSLSGLQTKQALCSCGWRLPVLLVVEKQVLVKDVLQKHLDHVSVHTYGPKRKAGIQHNQAVTLKCLLMQTHQEPLEARRQQISSTSSCARPSFA